MIPIDIPNAERGKTHETSTPKNYRQLRNAVSRIVFPAERSYQLVIQYQNDEP